jgi:hypothetical protein
MTTPTRHLTVHIDRPASAVYAFASDPKHLPLWAAGLGSAVEHVDGRWYVETAGGRVGLDFAPANEYGVLDHVVTLPDGEVVYSPVRVIADLAGGAGGCEVVFSLRRQPEMTDEDFERDATLVAADLDQLKAVLEKTAG